MAIRHHHLSLVELLAPFEIPFVTQATLFLPGRVDNYRKVRFPLSAGSSALHLAVLWQDFDACCSLAARLDSDASLAVYAGLTDDQDFTALELGAATRWPLLLPLIKAKPQYFMLCEARVEKLRSFNLLSVAIDFGNYLLTEFLCEIYADPASRGLVEHLF